MTDKPLVILLDFDGVLITTPPWRKVELLDDGFMAFNEQTVNNLVTILKETSASVVLTTTHRIRFNNNEWLEIFKTRGIVINDISKINAVDCVADMKSREAEIKEWVATDGANLNYIIIDDDAGLNNLPIHIKKHWVTTSGTTGLDASARARVLDLAIAHKKSP